jgi:hypothetical protein
MFISLLTAASVLPTAGIRAGDGYADGGGYDPIQASRDSYAYHHRLRLEQINRHLWLQDQMRWRSVWPRVPSYFCPLDTDLDAVYAHGTSPRGTPRRVFGPLPYVASDIWGYPLNGGVRQSIGQLHIQTGPNRWESRPVYPEDLVPAPIGRPPSDKPAPPLVKPTPKKAPEAVPPPKPRARGPVEF